jgi:smoothened protein
VQFLGGAREEIVCHSDKTIRLGEPSGHIDAAPCVIIFLLVYYFLMASAVWFAILAMSWDICFHSLTVPSDFFSGKTHYLHAIAWTLPLIKTIAILILREVDGDKLSGICFVGYQNLDMRAWFVFGPLGVYLTFGGFFLLRGLIRLCKLGSQAVRFNTMRRVQEMVIRIGIFAFLAFIFSLATFACHLYDYNHQESWEKSLEEYIVCQVINSTSGPPCEQSSRPSIPVTMLQLFSMFGLGVVMSSWMATPSSLRAWGNYLKRYSKIRHTNSTYRDRQTDTNTYRKTKIDPQDKTTTHKQTY